MHPHHSKCSIRHQSPRNLQPNQEVPYRRLRSPASGTYSRASAMLIVHNTQGRKASNIQNPSAVGTNHHSFENLQQHVTGLSIHPLTAIIPYSAMHEDICNLAEDERGSWWLTRVAVSQISRNIAVLFFGGPDDREALSYAWRMARHPDVSLTVFRFLPGRMQ
ncbi:hypothetical protein GIB67_042105 [Kingdonia uniflora]|uniref:Cation/H(+) antiporter C-terminal domain-containing protein n=1 Tax=Kingdonia uniflora TaxID=39325 RepID=A0A7J7LH35_9MAGN|nr:hypothetical protein GIB67_042105 [Kingdonia uniflora]